MIFDNFGGQLGALWGRAHLLKALRFSSNPSMQIVENVRKRVVEFL